MKNQRLKAKLMLFLGAVLLSSGGLCIKSISITNPLEINGLRSLVAAVFFMVVYKKQTYVKQSKWFPIVIISYTCMTSLYVAANLFTTAASAIILQFTAPIFALLFSVLLFKKMPNKVDIIAVFMVFVGIGIVCYDNSNTMGHRAMIGNMFAIVSGAFFSMKAISLTKVGEHHARSAIFFGNSLNFIIALPFMIFAWQMPTIKDALIILYLGTIQLGLSYMLYIKAVDYCSPLEIILIPAIEPVLNPVWVYILNGEKPGFKALVGGFIVILTVVIWNVFKDVLEDKKATELLTKTA